MQNDKNRARNDKNRARNRSIKNLQCYTTLQGLQLRNLNIRKKINKIKTEARE